ncbi:hypothetical protein JZ751_000691 [Albula glossodonta]|uniref:Plectin/eS10 N-terminal domain-containing protein n=1 Tax=Albula glossodonta TaxID=121402 RepID=A0A8T2PWT0_9TELE|nr:hypothetical protein JZ751_000691 [Albula glossodonta]
MVMPLGELKAIYELLFRDGVMVAKKDMRPQSKHPEVHGVTNLQVIKAMGSLKSRGYVRETFAWRHFYWYVTNEGIVYLRDFLRLPPEIVPSTLQRVRWPSTTLDVLRRAAHVQRVEGPTSYAPKPTSRSSVEKKESLMDRQGYRHRKKLTLEEEKQASMLKPRGSPRSFDPFKPRTSLELGSQSLASLKNSAEEEAQGPAEDLIPEDTQLQTEQDAAIYSMNNKLDADLEMKVIESEAQMGEEKVEENTLDSIDAELVTSCEATEAAWMEDTAVHEDHVDVSEEAEQITPDLPLEEVTPDFALEEMTPDLPLGQITQDLALGQHSPDLTLEKVTPEIPLEQVTPDFTLDQVTPDFTLDQVTPDFTLDHVTPDFTLDHVTPDFTLEQVTPDFTLEQVTPDLTLGQFTSHLALEGETPVQVDEKQAEAPPFMVLPPEAKPEIPSDITIPSDVTAMKKKVFLAEELIDIQNGSTSNTAENASELVNVTEVKMAHQEELDIEGEDSLIDIQEWTSLPEE